VYPVCFRGLNRITQKLYHNELENVQWIIIPLQIGDPKRWRRLESDVWKNYRPIEWCPASRQVALLCPPSRHRHCWQGHFRRWIAGKRYIPQQKSRRKGTSVGCPLGDGKSVGVAERFPWPVGWSQIGYPKKRVFGKFDPLMETLVECETVCR